MLANAFPRSPWSLPAHVGGWGLPFCHLPPVEYTTVPSCLHSTSSPFAPFFSNPTHSWSVCFLCVSASCVEGGGSGAAVRDTITHNSKAGSGRGGTMSPDRSSDLGVPRGRSQRGSTLPRRGTSISHRGRPARRTQQNGQKEQPTGARACEARAARASMKTECQRARDQDPQYTIVGTSQQTWKQHHPRRGRELPAIPDPPGFAFAIPCLVRFGACLSVSPVRLGHCPSFGTCLDSLISAGCSLRPQADRQARNG